MSTREEILEFVLEEFAERTHWGDGVIDYSARYAVDGDVSRLLSWKVMHAAEYAKAYSKTVRGKEVHAAAVGRYSKTDKGKAVKRAASTRYLATDKGREGQRAANRKYAADVRAAKKAGMSLTDYRAKGAE